MQNKSYDPCLSKQIDWWCIFIPEKKEDKKKDATTIKKVPGSYSSYWEDRSEEKEDSEKPVNDKAVQDII